MACICCDSINNSDNSETSEEVLTGDDAIKKQVEDFAEVISIPCETKEEGVEAFNSFVNNNPEYFWLPTNYSYSVLEGSIEIPMTFPYDTNKLESMKSDLDKKVDEIAQVAKSRVGDYERALFVHDFLIENCEYEESIVEAAMNAESGDFYIENTAYGCLLEGKALCGGYSKAYYLIMNELGIECLFASGTDLESNIPHAWNVIKMNGEYYHVDVTFDDPIVEGSTSNKMSYTFFGLTTKEILETRTIDEDLELPECTATADNYFVHNNYYLETYSFDSCKEILNTQFANSNIARIKFGSESECDKAMEELFTNHKIQDIITGTSVSYIASNKVLTVGK